MKNPIYKQTEKMNPIRDTNKVVTVRGVTAQLFVYILLVIAAGAYAWNKFTPDNTSTGMLIGLVLTAFVVALVTIFVPRFAVVGAPVYAVLEGLAIGMLSSLMEKEYPGIVIMAFLATVAVIVAMLILYVTRIIKVNQKFVSFIASATLGVLMLYIITFILQLCGVDVSFMHDNSALSIGISFLVVGIASFNLLADFYFIEEAVKSRQPRYMQSYLAFGVLITIVWLYLEILDLIRKIYK